MTLNVARVPCASLASAEEAGGAKMQSFPNDPRRICESGRERRPCSLPRSSL